MRRGLIGLLGLAPLLPAGAMAWNGQGAPNDPQYAPAERNPVTSCINDEQWYEFPFMPRCTPAAHDPEGTAGMSIDQVWRRLTTGRPGVRIAYIEGGPNWHDPLARKELATRMYLNTGELPLPERSNGSTCASYDCNGDGQVSVADYAQDPRVRRLNGDITPEDLIAAFGHCWITAGQTQSCPPGGHFNKDHDGYADDIRDVVVAPGRLAHRPLRHGHPPPVAAQHLRRSGALMRWTAPGGNWMDGRAACYEARACATAPTPAGFGRERRSAGCLPRPAPGRRNAAALPSGARYVALRAVDSAGLVSLPAALKRR